MRCFLFPPTRFIRCSKSFLRLMLRKGLLFFNANRRNEIKYSSIFKCKHFVNNGRFLGPNVKKTSKHYSRGTFFKIYEMIHQKMSKYLNRGSYLKLISSVAAAIHPPEIAENVPLSNRNAPDEQLPEKEKLIRFRYKNTDLDPMKNRQKQGA